VEGDELPLEEDAAVEEAEEDILPLEFDSSSIAANRSRINFPSACPRPWPCPSVDWVELVDEVELSEVKFAFQFDGTPLGVVVVESPF
jgi:hypothetical protein